MLMRKRNEIWNMLRIGDEWGLGTENCVDDNEGSFLEVNMGGQICRISSFCGVVLSLALFSIGLSSHLALGCGLGLGVDLGIVIWDYLIDLMRNCQ